MGGRHLSLLSQVISHSACYGYYYHFDVGTSTLVTRWLVMFLTNTLPVQMVRVKRIIHMIYVSVPFKWLPCNDCVQQSDIECVDIRRSPLLTAYPRINWSSGYIPVFTEWVKYLPVCRPYASDRLLSFCHGIWKVFNPRRRPSAKGTNFNNHIKYVCTVIIHEHWYLHIDWFGLSKHRQNYQL